MHVYGRGEFGLMGMRSFGMVIWNDGMGEEECVVGVHGEFECGCTGFGKGPRKKEFSEVLGSREGSAGLPGFDVLAESPGVDCKKEFRL